MRYLHKLTRAAEAILDGLLVVLPSPPRYIRRARWIIARCALFIGLAAVGLATLLLHLASRTAVAG